MNTVQTFKSGDDIFLKSDNKCMMTYGMKKKQKYLVFLGLGLLAPKHFCGRDKDNGDWLKKDAAIGYLL